MPATNASGAAASHARLASLEDRSRRVRRGRASPGAGDRGVFRARRRPAESVARLRQGRHLPLPARARGEGEVDLRRAAEIARRAGNAQLERAALTASLRPMAWGPTPAGAGVEYCTALVETRAHERCGQGPCAAGARLVPGHARGLRRGTALELGRLVAHRGVRAHAARRPLRDRRRVRRGGHRRPRARGAGAPPRTRCTAPDRRSGRAVVRGRGARQRAVPARPRRRGARTRRSEPHHRQHRRLRRPAQVEGGQGTGCLAAAATTTRRWSSYARRCSSRTPSTSSSRRLTSRTSTARSSPARAAWTRRPSRSSGRSPCTS